MGYDDKLSSGGSRDVDFGFAFNNSNFSDRVLRIEIVADPTEYPPESEACQTPTDCMADRKSKRRRGEQENGDEAPPCRNSDEDGSSVLRVETFHVNSLPLASNSPFFYKLFSNGMLESKKQCVTLRIDASEEAAFMEMLNFMYSGTLRVNTASAVLDVLIVADKFGVASCMSHCCGVLKDMDMTLESALLYLELPTRSEAVKPLMDAANQFLVACYKDVLKHNDEVMNLPLAGIEVILSSDDLQVPSEDSVYDMALAWAEIHYQKNEERRDILCTHLSRYIRFPYMSLDKLRTVLTCSYFNKDFATKAVLDAMFFKSDNLNRQRTWGVEDLAPTNHHFVERAYIYRPIKVLEFELPHQHSVVYLDLKREECPALLQSGWIGSQTFLLGGHVFFLSAQCSMDHQHFGLFLNAVEEKDPSTFAFDYEVSIKMKPLEKYITACSGNYEFAIGNATGGNPGRYWFHFLSSIPWTPFVANDSPCFINGVMQIRVEITIKR